MESRFELSEIKQRDGTVHVIITAYHRIEGSEERVGANTRCSSTFFNRYWRYKDGHLFTINDKADWIQFSERNPETEFVLAAVAAHGYL
jgi:hypothetical protein